MRIYSRATGSAGGGCGLLILGALFVLLVLAYVTGKSL